MAFFIYSSTKKLIKKNSELFSEEVDEFDQANEKISKYLDYENLIPENIKFIEISVFDEDATEGITYKSPKKITDPSMINDIIEKLNDSEKYENFEDDFGAGDFFEGCPIINIYDCNDNIIMVTACDNFSQDEEENFFNTMMVWKKLDGTDKKIYKVNNKLQNYIEEIYEQN